MLKKNNCAAFCTFRTAVLLLCLSFGGNAFAQGYGQASEIGVWLGASNFRGDVASSISSSTPALGVVYRYAINDYLAFRAGVALTFLRGNDANSESPFVRARNLSFSSHLVELSSQLDLHFMKFKIGDEKHYFTPYLTTGIAVFQFNPTTKYNDERYSLPDIGTEGQQNDLSGRKPYKQLQLAIPAGGGIKFWMRKQWTFYAEAAYRNTFTDYLDDVSTTYIDSYLLGDGTTAAALADRSGETGIEPIGEEGRQRGDSTNKDGYWLLNVGLTYAIIPNRCPKSK